MKKIILLLCLCLFVFSGCGKKKDETENQGEVNPPAGEQENLHTIYFVDSKSEILYETTVKDGDDLVFPEIECKEGYHYIPNFKESELLSITEDKLLEVKLKEYEKTINYYIDGELIECYEVRYSVTPKEPEFDSSMMESYEWIFTDETVGTNYVYTYNLKYVRKTKFNITYYNGSNIMNLAPATYNSTEGVKLPTPNEEGYQFVGWYLSDISLASYEEIPVGAEGDFTLYARFIEIEKHETFTLPEASAHFTGVNYDALEYIYSPILPNDARSSSVLDYNWTSSDPNILNCTTFSSFYIGSTGYAVITATLKSDKTYKINGVFKTTIDGVTLAQDSDVNNLETVTVTFAGMNNEVLSTQTIVKGTFAYLPTPPTYSNYVFAGWNQDNYNIIEDTTFKAIYSRDIVNPYVGKTISFLGDSLTSYLPYIPSGYASFFPYPTADVNDVNQMWWMQVTNKLGAKMFITNGWGGTCVQGSTDSTSSMTRLKTLVVDNKYSDYLIIYMGSNDAAANKKYPDSYTPETFEESYRRMLDNLKSLCPNTTIILTSLSLSNSYSKETMIKYNKVINNLAVEYGLKYLNISSVNLTVTGGERLIVDSGHPTAAGMKIIANAIYTELTKK